MHPLLPESVIRLRNLACEIAQSTLAPAAAAVDREACWPAHAMAALGDAGLLGLHVPIRLGGQEQGLLALTVINEVLGQHCASSAMCFTMHCVGTAVIAAKATPYHEQRYLVPIAENRHITTLALSEAGTGAHFYLPQTALERDGDWLVARGRKDFVTNGGHADSYVVSTLASDPEAEAGDFSCLLVDRDSAGLEWLAPWQGMGMRGNSSRSMNLDGARLPAANLLGAEGDQIWYTFEIVAPYFLIGMAGVYLGLAQAALDIAIAHVKRRRYDHNGESLAEQASIQTRIADMALAVQKSRSLIYQAAYLGDVGDADATAQIMMAKADAATLAVELTNQAMTCCGGQGYRENGELSRLLRDARAGHVMSPTTDLLRLWAGRLLLDIPLF